MGSSLYFTLTCFIWAALNGKRTPTFLPGRDTRKQKPPIAYVQFDRPEMVLYADTGLVDIKFGEEKFLKGCMPRVKLGGRVYTPRSKSQKNRLVVEGIEEDVPASSELGKVLETAITWAVGDTGKRVVGKVSRGVDAPFVHFKLVIPWECQLASKGKFAEPAIEYPLFGLQGSCEHVLTWASTKFAPPRTDFKFTLAPVVMYDDELNAFAFSSLDRFLVTGIRRFKASRAMSAALAGTVERTPEGFALESVVLFGKGINKIVEDWGALVRKRHAATGGGQIRDPYSNPITAMLGYNTDNGAYYYYNTEKGKNYEDTMIAVRERHKRVGLPYGYYELDSWWYPKSYEKLPAIIKIFVSGSAMHWGEPPKPDIFPHGLKYVWEKLDKLPLMCHSRWFSPKSHYVKEYDFYVQKGSWRTLGLPLFAAPRKQDFWDDLFKASREWGLRCYLQDWLNYQYENIRPMKHDYDFAEAWTTNMARGAEKHGMTLQYCMAPSSFMVQAVKLPNVLQARASDDHNGMQPRRWYMPHFTATSMLCHAVGIWPHKDTFFSSDEKVYWFYREKRPEMECLAAALSGGPVAPSDKIGNEDVGLIMKTCRSDGLLLKPDKPATPVDLMFKQHAKYYVTSTFSKKESFTWHYLHVSNLWPSRVKDKSLSQEELAIKGQYAAFLFGKQEFLPLETPATKIAIDLPYEGQELVVLCPEIIDGVHMAGNPTKFVTCSAKQFPAVDVDDDWKSAVVHVEGVPGEVVPVLFSFAKKVPKIKAPDGQVEVDQQKHVVLVTVTMDGEGKREIDVDA
ncbi:MAG: hypothetical protein JW839_01900 [Candidatus Lokiarchaeota archaeon]|nr:hypothetical protein [Candidatus Lokiarchaeota archaeon]